METKLRIIKPGGPVAPYVETSEGAMVINVVTLYQADPKQPRRWTIIVDADVVGVPTGLSDTADTAETA